MISIHSLVKRETLPHAISLSETSYFNPLPRKEGDNGELGFLRHGNDFNPLPRKEGDLLLQSAR